MKSAHPIKDEAGAPGTGASIVALHVLPTQGERVMSSREIAELTGKRHDNVMRDARAMLVELHGAGGALRFEETHRDPQNGQTYPVLALPKRETMVLVSGYSVTMRARVIDRLQELEDLTAKPAGDPMTLLQDPAIVRGLLLSYADKVIALEHAAQVQAPKVAYADALLGAEGDILIGDAAKALELPIMKLRRTLREKRVLNANGLPAAHYVTKGYFRVKLGAGPNGKVFQTPMVTMLGVEWLRRFWSRSALAQAAAGTQGSLL